MKKLVLAMVMTTAPAFGDVVSISSDGINSEDTQLNGAGILIGQAEPFRSARALFDTDPLKVASNTAPAGVYFTTGSSGMNMHINDHATGVAGVMIAKDASLTGMSGDDYGVWRGVAPEASLHSGAVSSVVDDELAALTMNRIATLASGTVRATNVSFNRDLQTPVEQPNGNVHVTQFIDWSSRQHDLLYVVAWGNSDQSFGPRAPVDNYNGITVGASQRRMNEDVWTSFGTVNTLFGFEPDDSQDIEILAPGHGIRYLVGGDTELIRDGTSLAAPHVTGATALLQQHSLQQMQGPNPNPRFTSRSQKHQLMKAVMLNSADKISGVHGSARTICDSSTGPCNDWTVSEAYIDPTTPLDDRMGAGHLNVERAVQQLAPGEYSVGEFVPHIGWGVSSIGGVGSSLNFIFDQPLGSGYVAITLVWDRRIESTGGTTYNSGDQFFNSGVANLDLSLENSTGTVVYAESRSEDKNVEHIFIDLESAGASHIRIRHAAGDIGVPGGSTEFAIAWWYGSDASTPGDYNKNGSVGPEDYDVWKSNFGTNFADADGNENGTVDAGDYTVWRDNFGAGSGGGSLAAVPEPASVVLAIVFVGVPASFNQRKFAAT